MATPSLPVGVAIYTDGSARPNPGFYGSGLHGYAYRFPNEGEAPTRINSLIATTKGYVYKHELEKQNAKPVVITEYLDSYVAATDAGTNNIAEINAVSVFFEHYPDLVAIIQELHVIADSQYTINGAMKWLDGWRRNHWVTKDGKPVSNRAQWERLAAHLDAFRKVGIFDMTWVHGHNDDFGNVRADYLAGIATNHGTDGNDTVYCVRTPPLRYHKVDEIIHPLLGLKRIYFSTDPEINVPGSYYQTGWVGPTYITGKRTCEAAFSVVQLAEPDRILEAIIQTQCAAPTNMRDIVFIRLERLRSQDVIPFIRDHGKYCLIPDPRNRNLNFLDGKPMTHEVEAGELPLRTIDVLNHLGEILNHWRDTDLSQDTSGFIGGGTTYRLHDITDHFYQKTEKKVGKAIVEGAELKKEFIVGIVKTEVKIQETVRGEPRELTLPLLFMDDIPSRNTMKKLETRHPKVYFVTWNDSESVIRYATIIRTDDAVGIWSNYFANQLFV